MALGKCKGISYQNVTDIWCTWSTFHSA